MKDLPVVSLQNKNILFLSPRFFSYEVLLKNELERLGAKVTYFDERPSNSVLGKTLLRINRNLIKKQIDAYYKNILQEITGKDFSYILICQAEATPLFFLEALKEQFPKTLRVLYLWDSVKNKVNTVEKVSYFQSVASFDYQDCQKYGWQFRPLFFDHSYEVEKNKKSISNQSAFFVGTIHSDRYAILESIKKQFRKEGKPVFYYYYLPTPLMFYYFRYGKKILGQSHKNDFHYEALAKDILQEKLALAEVVVDIQHPNQTGLTMRTIEMLGSGKKLITTNPDIIHYDFFNPKNIAVVDRKNAKVSEVFLQETYQEVPRDIYTRYRIDYFLGELLQVIPMKEGGYYRE